LLSVPEERSEVVLTILKNDPDIEFAERDYIAQACMIDNDPLVVSGVEWHLETIQALEAWEVTIGTPSTIIAVLDSGVNSAHPDLSGRVLPGYDFVNNDSDAGDDFGHGTAVAGTLVARGNNGLGVAGVAYGCSVLPVKVMDQFGSASHSTIALGIEYAVQHGARIVNLSLGGDWPSSTLQNAINYAWSNNVVVVAAAGNNGSTVPQYPGACEHVLAVASSEPDDSRSPFSNYGSYVALFAPGDDIWTTQKDLANPYGAWRGTSFSSPVVAAVAALALSLNPSLSNTQIVDLLKQTSDHPPFAAAASLNGIGRINALHAVNGVTPAPGLASPAPQPLPPPVPVVLPPASSQEAIPPSVTIVDGPSDGARLFTPVVNLSGRATDNVQIDHVEFQVNEGLIQFCSGTTDWTTQVELVPGYNLIRVRSVDTAGNTSPETTRAVTYVFMAPLVLRTNGVGLLAFGFRGMQLEVGKTYRIRAVPGPGQLFAGWTGGLNSDGMALSFIMQTNLELVANFIPNPFPVVRGKYAGLMANAHGITPDSSGYFSLSIARSGSFTGRIMNGGKRFAFSGRFNISGNAQITIPRGLASPLTLALQVDLSSGSNRVGGKVKSGEWTSDLLADRNVFDRSSNPAQQAGLHAFDLRAQDSAAAASGMTRISTSGVVNVRGKLNDGQAFTTASALAINGDCPFYLSRNRGAEVVIGWLNFGQPAASGTVLWMRTGTNAFASTLQAAPGT